MGSMRITGIASGMDTETMVKDLMKAERVKLDKIEQEKQLSLWRQEQYNDINKTISQFILDTRKDLFGTSERSKDPSSLTWVNKATSSDESIFTASSKASAPTGTHTMKVKKMAKGVYGASQSTVLKNDDSEADGNTKIAELKGVSSVGTFTINDEKITVDNDTTINDLVKLINDSDAGVQASFDDNNGRLFLSTKETGANSKIQITSDTGDLFKADSNVFNISVTDPSDLPGSPKVLKIGTSVSGEDAEVEFDGAQKLTYSSNTFTINGIDINLNSIPANTDTEYTIKVDTDVDAVYDKIKGFVDKYNELIENLNKEISEKRYRDYAPLTKDQKESMSEDDIKLWEQKAKSGLLRNDEYTSKLLQNVRSGLYDPVKTDSGNLSPYSQLFEIGITTGEWKDKGKLVISDDPETGLKAAIQKDASAVMELLFNPSDEDVSSKSGLVNRMYDNMIDGMKEIINKSGTGDNTELYRSVKSNILIDFVTGGDGRQGSISLIDEEVLAFETRITREQERLIEVEERYWSQFSAMERAISEMQSQSSWLAGQMG